MDVTISDNVCLQCIHPITGLNTVDAWYLPGGEQLINGQSIGMIMVVNFLLVLQNPRDLVPDGDDDYRVNCFVPNGGYEARLYSSGM